MEGGHPRPAMARGGCGTVRGFLAGDRLAMLHDDLIDTAPSLRVPCGWKLPWR